MVVAYSGYEKFIENYHSDGDKEPLTGVINKSHHTKTEGFVAYALFGQPKQSVENRVGGTERSRPGSVAAARGGRVTSVSEVLRSTEARYALLSEVA